MGAWKVLLILAITGGGFATGYMSKEMRSAEPLAASPSAPVMATPQAAVDESLILPPPDMKGVVLEPAGMMIKGHFQEMAGFKIDPLPGIEQAHFGITQPVEAEKPLVKLRLNFSLDVDIPRSKPRESAFKIALPTLNPRLEYEPLSMPRISAEEKERCTGVVEAGIEQ